ncbi:PREDICTED: calcium-transporting ATPase 12, plasma membrane-type [Theobroma cacao]|uniref:Calcium-transporting ATPase n=1 Tax=Theobroma cacao TaxID=3641 RepID=A0AB32V619_THECC|nr:PREDICTED: calcium-transporting ATPase 12, plasma membrane-type [Theobroma cacao]
MSLRCRKPGEPAMPDADDTPVAKRQQRRWRTVFAAIYSARILVSLYKKVINDKQILRTLSYIAIDIHEHDSSDHHLPSLWVDQKTLTEMVREKNLENLRKLGGVKKIAVSLETDEKDGISGNEADLTHRMDVFGANRYQKPPIKSLLSFIFEAFKDTTIIILLVCAILSLGFGIKQHGVEDGWHDGGSIIFAVFLVVVISAVSNFKQNRQFEKLSNESSDIRVDVVRDGRRQFISVFEVVVGDVVCLKIGDQIPADGLFLDGHSLKVDESSMTGESDHVEINGNNNPFMLSGTKVTDGFGFMLVTSVGMNTAWGKMMSSINRDLDEETPLQARLNKLTSYIGKIGLTVAILVLAVLLIRYFTGNTKDDKGNKEYIRGKTKLDSTMNSVVNIISAAITIVVVAIPEGLPLAVTLTLAYSMKQMMADHAMVRKLSACETMGSATTICTDKTGTLTLNEMKVTEFWLGNECMKDSMSTEIAPNVHELLQQAIALNTTGTVYKPNSRSLPEISGSPTEKAILSWAVLDLGMNVDNPKQDYDLIQVAVFNSAKKRSGVLIRRKNESATHTHWKGAAEMIVAMCSQYYDRGGMVKVMDDEERTEIGKIIQNMAAKSLRCIAFAHTKIPEDNEQVLGESRLTLVGLVGLKDPCRPGVRRAVESCIDSGVNIKMITGDNVFTAKAMAIECGILQPHEDVNEAVIEGIEFRNYSPEERMEKINKVRVMARSSPFDKLLMVQCLKQKGHVVAVTGDGTNDAPALKEADIGLSMGIQGTEVAKESSDIVILDDNFTSVMTVLRWGRCVYNNIQKFIQFQLTANVAALVINFIGAISSGEVPLTAVQLLWVNLIMDTFGALALATERPTDDLMTKPPVGRSKPLISNIMWRNLIAQALYQVAVLLTLQFRGKSVFGVDERVKNTLIFNTFVFCQVFNEFNARKLEKKNIFKGLHKNKLFLGIIGITIILQVVMVEFLKRFANTQRLNWGQWGSCIGLAALSWPIGWLVQWIPV